MSFWSDNFWSENFWTANFWTTGGAPPVDPTTFTALMDAIRFKTGGTTVQDGLSSYFSQAPGESLADAEFRWLGEQGATGTSRNDRWRNFLTSEGHSGALCDQLLAYWNSVADP